MKDNSGFIVWILVCAIFLVMIIASVYVYSWASKPGETYAEKYEKCLANMCK